MNTIQSNIKNPHPGNIENFIGYAPIPVGLCGPLTIKGKTPVSIPLATTEGALVASYSRGCKAINLSGGVTTYLIEEGVQRCPLFKFGRLEEAIKFSNWIDLHSILFSQIVKSESNHAKLKSLDTIIEGNTVIVKLTYSTGDAAGQNMVTFCTDAICKYILSHTSIPIIEWYIESNLSGDKKASNQYLQSVRGKRVVADVVISAAIVKDILKSTPRRMEAYWKASLLSQIQGGSISAQGHVANGLAALFLATGQDVACISEASVGIGRLDQTSEGDLYASITLPQLIVGTVGGGTSMEYAQKNLEMMGCKGANKSKKFAEIAAGLALAGELSIAAAIAEDQFTSAHKSLGRK